METITGKNVTKHTPGFTSYKILPKMGLFQLICYFWWNITLSLKCLALSRAKFITGNYLTIVLILNNFLLTLKTTMEKYYGEWKNAYFIPISLLDFERYRHYHHYTVMQQNKPFFHLECTSEWKRQIDQIKHNFNKLILGTMYWIICIHILARV